MNGTAAALGTKVRAGHDVVALDGVTVEAALAPRRWVVLHKPLQVVTTRSDEKGRETVMDLLPGDHQGLFPVGRLDMMTTGLLLLTDDGELANDLLHPSRHVEKTYQATLDAPLAPDALAALRRGGLELDGRPTQPARVTRRGPKRYRVQIHEGRNRQVRRMFEAVGRQVRRLHRSHFGPLTLGDLPPGHHRPLTADELAALRRAAGRNPQCP